MSINSHPNRTPEAQRTDIQLRTAPAETQGAQSAGKRPATLSRAHAVIAAGAFVAAMSAAPGVAHAATGVAGSLVHDAGKHGERAASEAASNEAAVAAEARATAIPDGQIKSFIAELDAPYANLLQSELKEKFSTHEKLAELRARVRATSNANIQIMTGFAHGQQSLLNKINAIEQKLDYYEANAETLAKTTFQLSQLGNRAEERSRTQQGFAFDNGDLTGIYVRPGVEFDLNVYIDTEVTEKRFSVGRKQIARPENHYNEVNLYDFGGENSLGRGKNTIHINARGKKTGWVLYLRNNTTQPARVRLEVAGAGYNSNAENPLIGNALGFYPIYSYDAEHPELFWDYLQGVRDYVTAGVETKTGQMLTSNVGLDAVGLKLGRSIYQFRAELLVSITRSIKSEEEAIAYVERAYRVNKERLDFFDELQGFDANDENPANWPTQFYDVTDADAVIKDPSDLFAWSYYHHIPESSIAGSLDGTGLHGWGIDHEFGHMLDISPLAVAEETNNLFPMYGLRRQEIAAMEAAPGKQFNVWVYHKNIVNASASYQTWLRHAIGGKATTQWNNGTWGTMMRWQVLQYFDSYVSYDGYDFASSAFSREDAEEVLRWGGLGALYRTVRENPGAYEPSVTGSKLNSMVRAYSDALGYDMGEFFNRTLINQVSGSAAITQETYAYCAKYPKLEVPLEYYTMFADAKGLNGTAQYAEGTEGPAVTSKTQPGGRIAIKASYPEGSAEAASTIAYEVRRNGQRMDYSTTGELEVELTNHSDTIEVVAYDWRLNASAATVLPTTATIGVHVEVAGGAANPLEATITVTPSDGGAEWTQAAAGADTTLEDVPSGTISVTLEGYEAYPAKATVDARAWNGETLQFTLVSKEAEEGRTARAKAPVLRTASGEDNLLGYTIDDVEDATIFYTTDGSEPTASSPVAKRWTGAGVEVPELPDQSTEVVVKARAYKAGLRPSAVATLTLRDARTATLFTSNSGSVGEWQPAWSEGVGSYTQHAVNDRWIRAANVGEGLKLTMYTGANFTGSSYAFTGVNYPLSLSNDKLFFDGVKSFRVERTSAPKAQGVRTISFAAGDASARSAAVTAEAREAMHGVTIHKGGTMTVPDVLFEREGWAADGWQGSDGKVYQPGDVLEASGVNLTLTARWKHASYLVAFDANGGTGSMGVAEYGVQDEAHLPEVAFTREGYTFAGWQLPDGTYLSEGVVPAGTATYDGQTLVLKAMWEPIRYTVAFAAGAEDAKGETESLTLAYDEVATVPTSGFMREGYRFVHWVDEQGLAHEAGQEIAGLASEDGATVTFTAEWEKEPAPEVPGEDEPGDVPGGDDTAEPEAPETPGNGGAGGSGGSGGAVVPDEPEVPGGGSDGGSGDAGGESVPDVPQQPGDDGADDGGAGDAGADDAGSGGTAKPSEPGASDTGGEVTESGSLSGAGEMTLQGSGAAGSSSTGVSAAQPPAAPTASEVAATDGFVGDVSGPREDATDLHDAQATEAEMEALAEEGVALAEKPKTKPISGVAVAVGAGSAAAVAAGAAASAAAGSPGALLASVVERLSKLRWLIKK